MGEKNEAAYDAESFEEKCAEREAHGYDSGMGAIFLKALHSHRCRLRARWRASTGSL